MEQATTEPVTGNARFLAMTLSKASEEGGTWTMAIYLLNPGDLFEGFGGSRHGLLVKKTASLVVRYTQPHGMTTDTEYDVNDQKAWGMITGLLRADGVTVVK